MGWSWTIIEHMSEMRSAARAFYFITRHTIFAPVPLISRLLYVAVHRHKNGGAILLSGVWSLAIDLRWIVRSPEQIEQFVVACLAGIKRDLYYLGALHIAGDHRGHTRRFLKNCLCCTKNNPLRDRRRLPGHCAPAGRLPRTG